MVVDKGTSESVTLIFGQLLAYAGSGINKVTADFGAGINGAGSILSNRLMIL